MGRMCTGTRTAVFCHVDVLTTSHGSFPASISLRHLSIFVFVTTYCYESYTTANLDARWGLNILDYGNHRIELRYLSKVQCLSLSKSTIESPLVSLFGADGDSRECCCHPLPPS